MTGPTLPETYAGLRVLDLSSYIAGPLAAMTLGDLGADVIKIERPPGGDETRAMPPHHDGIATLFQAVNRNKRSLAMDFRRGAGRDALLRLAADADVVVESFPPGVGAKLSLTYEDFRAVNPRLVLCTISAFGDGPLGSKMPGYDGLVQAVSGLTSFTGTEGQEAVRLAPSVLDISTGMWGVIGIMGALARRAVGGEGDHVRPALLDTAVQVMNHQVLSYMASGEPPRKWGSGSPSAVPFRIFEASDGAFMLATASDAQFPRLCAVVGREELAERFPTMADRVAARDAVDATLAEVFATKPLHHWLTVLAEARLSVGRVNDVAEALELDITKERELFVAPEQVGWDGGMPILRPPFDPSGSSVRLPPPRLGAHSDEVLREAGFSDGERAALLAG
jgi:crotonobetainyl-CoA:carnitine CoA-transferase CaiB-like acyl-CoA transferase